MLKRFAVLLLLFTAVFFALPMRETIRAQAKQHAIVISWTAGVPNAALGQTADASYNVKRSTVSGGPYTTLNAAPVLPTTFSDTTGTGGTIYFYIVTGVDSNGFESANSSEVSATFLGSPAVPGAVTATRN
jgi:fibronectin type 3 domain-containing protein